MSGLILAVLGMFIYDRVRRRIRVQYVHHYSDRVVREVHDLYLERIDPAERVPPTYVTHCLGTPEICIRNARHLSAFELKGGMTGANHLLLAAWCYGDVVGILKGIVVGRAKMLYVAYAATSSETAAIQRKIFPLLLQELKSIVRNCRTIDWLVFETSTTDENSATAKDRHFRHNAERFGMALRRVECEYLQPDLEYPISRASKELPAYLYIGATRTRTTATVPRSIVELILDAIYFDVYLETWRVHHPEANQADLRDYVTTLRDMVTSDLAPEVRLL